MENDNIFINYPYIKANYWAVTLNFKSSWLWVNAVFCCGSSNGVIIKSYAFSRAIYIHICVYTLYRSTMYYMYIVSIY